MRYDPSNDTIGRMKRVRRWVLNGTTALSLLLFIAAISMGVRSYWRFDSFDIKRYVDWQFISNGGVFTFSRSISYPARVVNPKSATPKIIQPGPAEPASS